MVRQNEDLLAEWAELEGFVLERAGEVLDLELSPGP